MYNSAYVVYRCSECGNSVSAEEVPSLPDMDGTKGRLTFEVFPVCHHGLPYTMQRMPKSAPFEARHPRRSPR